MSGNNILDFLSKTGKFESLDTAIGLETCTAIIALRIKNYLIIKSLLSAEACENLLKSTETFIGDFLKNHLVEDCKFSIARMEPYYCINLDNDSNLQKLVNDLDHLLMMYNYPEHDVQFTITCASITHNKNADDIFRNMIRILESDNQRSGIVKYNDNITQILMKKYDMLSNLKSSLKARLARFAYQPIIECATGGTSYYECLLRIPNNEGELVSAGPSILLAEKYGIIHCVDRAVIKMAARELALAKDLKLSVNISNIGLLDDRLLEEAQTVLCDRDIASRLIIEITETSVNQDFERTSHFVNIMHNLGCKIAIDDFGAGSTSFGQLQKVKFDILKIDGSLIRDIANNSYNRFLVELLIKVATEVGAKTVAEFVENGAIAKFLLDSKIDFMQGNFFSPAQNFRTWSKE